MKRLMIYFFYDKDGIVDNYIPYFLRNFRKYCSEICVVINGILTDEGRCRLEGACDRILIRENFGYDAHAYKYALEAYGYDTLKQYDEVLLANFTIFGPIFDLENFFNTMDNKVCDWWGLYESPQQDPVCYNHIPSFFVNYKTPILHSKYFKEYWDTLSEINSYADSVKFHEQRQTPYYDKLGFKKATYIDFNKFKKYHNKVWEYYCADKMLVKEKYPFVKRRLFFISKKNFLYEQKVIISIIKYLKENTDYDINLILENIKRTQDLDSLNLFRLKKILSIINAFINSQQYIANKNDFIKLFNKTTLKERTE